MPEEIKNETTNAVLKEMIIGLTKITDDRLLNLKEGVAEIKTLMQGFVTRQEFEDSKKDFNSSVKRIEEDFVKHNEDDKISFAKITDGQQALQDTIKFWLGGLAAIVFLISLGAPLVYHFAFHF